MNPSSLNHRPIRDMCWALCQPPLLRQLPDCPHRWLQQDLIDEDIHSWLVALDQMPAALYSHLEQQRSTRLGIYFEQLLSFFFSHYPRFSLLALNHQVNDHKQTIGEFDFIVFDKLLQQYRHIEVAIKFYLGHADYPPVIAKNKPYYNWHQWVGPSQQDTLAIKMRHLLHHQLPLSTTPLGQRTLTEAGILPTDQNIYPSLLLSGRFYFPLHTNLSPPNYFHLANKTPWWIDSHGFLKLNDVQFINQKMGHNIKRHPQQLLYIVLPRKLWISPILSNDIQDNALSLSSYDELQQQVQRDYLQGTSEWHVAIMQEVKGKQFDELHRFFIINSDKLPFGE